MNRREVAAALYGGCARHFELTAHLTRDYVGESSFAQTGSAVQKDVFKHFAPLFCGVHIDG